MLKMYIISIFIYMLIIYCMAIVFESNVRKNGWIDENKHATKWEACKTLFCIAAIPIIRFLTVVMIFIMAGYTKEKFYEYCEQDKINEDK